MCTDTTSDSVTESIVKGNQVGRIVGCADSFQDLTTHTERVLDCLREVEAWSLMVATVATMLPKFLFFMPTFKSEYLPLLTSDASAAGAFAPVDALVSVVSNEGTFPFTYQTDYRLLDPDLKDVSAGYFRAMSEELINMWEKDKVVPLGVAYLDRVPPDDKLAMREAACDFFGKQNAYCPSRLFAESHSNNGSELLTWMTYHTFSEFLFSMWTATPMKDRNFSLVVMRSLTNFVRNGTPGLPSFEKWPRFSLDNPSFVWLQPGNYGIVNDFYSAGCELWRRFL
ncbi:hypothetical protein MRX96_029805 [Rhipicephalus microplus]